MLCGLLLLHAPVLWLSGLPGPPEETLRVPWDGGLLAPVGPVTATSFGVTDKGSMFAIFDSLQASVIKLPTTTCNGNGKSKLHADNPFLNNIRQVFIKYIAFSYTDTQPVYIINIKRATMG